MPEPQAAYLHAILRAALAAADARQAVRQALHLEDATLRVNRQTRLPLDAVHRVLLLAAGKAAPAMALGARDVLGERITRGVLVTVDATAAEPLPSVDLWRAGHPLPDARGLAAAGEALHLARQAGEDDLLLCLLSGGASALWPAPPPGVPLGELRRLTRALLRAGVPIAELNTVRKHLSRLAGGQLARVAAPARLLALVVSDVVGSAPEAIASGPTVPDPTTYADALAVLARYGVEPPPAVRAHLQAGAAGALPETPKPGDLAFARTATHVVLCNRDALQAAAQAAAGLGYAPRIVGDTLQGEARDAAREIVQAAREARDAGERAALLWGGETTVTVRGGGTGGRSQELALAAALLLDGEPGIALAAFGTDGRDGPTDAAGAIVDGRTLARARELGLDAEAALRRNDAYPLLDRAGALLRTGPTGTNVNDVLVVVVES